MSKNAEEALKTIEGLQEIIVKARIADNENRENFYKLKAENARLKEINREMYETLKSIHFYLQQIGSVDSLLRNSLYQEQEVAVRKMLVKAECRDGEGE